MAYQQGQGSSNFKKPAGAGRPTQAANSGGGNKPKKMPTFGLYRATQDGEERITGLFENRIGSSVTVSDDIFGKLQDVQAGDQLFIYGTDKTRLPAYNLVRSLAVGRDEKAQYKPTGGKFETHDQGAVLTVTPSVVTALRNFQVGDSICVFTADKK